MNFLFLSILTLFLISCSTGSSQNIITNNSTKTMDNTSALVHPSIQLAYQFNWDIDSFPKTIVPVYTSALSNAQFNNNELKEQARKDVKIYKHLKSYYVYDPYFYTLYKVVNKQETKLLYNLSAYLSPTEKLVHFILDKHENCYLISSETEKGEIINTIQKISLDGHIQFQHHRTVEDGLAWEKGIQTFYLQLVHFDHETYVLGRNSNGSSLYRIDKKNGQLNLIYELKDDIRSILTTDKGFLLVNRASKILEVDVQGNLISENKDVLKGYTNVIAVNNKGGLYAYYDNLVEIQKESGTHKMFPMVHLIPSGEDFYYQLQPKLPELNDASNRIEITIYKNDNNNPITFSFPAKSIPDYKSLRLVNVERNKIYFTAGKRLNHKVYVFDLKTHYLVDQQAYHPLKEGKNYSTQHNRYSWGIHPDGTIFLPVQGTDAFYIFKLNFN